MRAARLWIGLALLLPVLSGASAAEVELRKVDLTYSPEAVKRGAETVTSVCMACHSLKYLKYRDLLKLGYTPGEVDVKRGENDIDSPLLGAMPPDSAIQAFGKVPPDLSLMALAREGGGRYIFSMVTGFYLDPAGNVDNRVFHGIKMPDILGFSGVTDAAQRTELEHTVRDAVIFLQWAADPKAQERRTLGIYVLGYLMVLTTLMYFLKRRIWGTLR
jgi:ubiquinol-cytochrome c reductase cytochrome c1 subunit